MLHVSPQVNFLQHGGSASPASSPAQNPVPDRRPNSGSQSKTGLVHTKTWPKALFNMLLLPRQELGQLLRCLARQESRQLVDALSEGMAALHRDDQRERAERSIAQPMRTIITNEKGDRNLFMPSSNGSISGAKIISRPGGGGDLNGILNIFETDGRQVGILSAGEFTAFRTALVTMAMFARSPVSKRNVLIFGAGMVAAWHARLAVLLFPDEIQSLTFINRSQKGLDRLASETIPDIRQISPKVVILTLSQGGNPDYDSALRKCVVQSEAIFGCTSATSPLFPYSYLGPQQREAPSTSRFISLVGSCKPHMQEVDTDTLLSGGQVVFVDSKAACLEESGEIIRAKMIEDDLVEMGEIFEQEKNPGDRLAVLQGQNLVFKSVGVGHMDLVVGREMFKIAASKGAGVYFENF